MAFIDIHKAKSGRYKYYAVFEDEDGEFEVGFGAKGYEDYTTHKDPERKKRYIQRHKNREDWDDPYTAGALSRWILWNKPTLEESVDDYVRRFKF